MPVEFLSDSQVARYGCFAEEVSPAELEQFFRLSEADRIVVEGRRRAHNRLGYAIQLGTVRMLGTFLASPADVPVSVAKFAAEQLKIADLSCLADYGARGPTPYEHLWDIRRRYGYRDFAEAEDELRAFGMECSRCGAACRRARGRGEAPQ